MKEFYDDIHIIKDEDKEDLTSSDEKEIKLWTVAVPKGMTPLKAYELCEKEFKCYIYNKDWLKTIIEDRKTDKEYSVSFIPTIEANPNLKSLSADDLKEKNIQGITLTERLLLELQYFKETGKHLDIDNITLCSGSRDSDGDVPGCGWCDDEFGVLWCGPSGRGDGLRAREVVTLVPSSFNPSRDEKTIEQKEAFIIERVETLLPKMSEVINTDANTVILHQDAFAADYQEKELVLLGMAIKYLGIHGKGVTIVGTNRETLKGEVNAN